jgi:hypothetical protein
MPWYLALLLTVVGVVIVGALAIYIAARMFLTAVLRGWW